MNTLGRNDPCHCGSGKKYKSCHWREDQARAAERAALERARRERLAAIGQPNDNQMRQVYEEMTGKTLPPGPVSAEMRDMLAEMWQQDQLAVQARNELEPEREQWESYFADKPEEFEATAVELAENEFFEQYTLTDQNIGRVRRQLGELPEENDALQTYASEAVALSLDEEDRSSFNRAILSLLPELVEQGRMKEAYVLTTCADRVLDPDAPLSPFLRDVVVRSVRVE